MALAGMGTEAASAAAPATSPVEPGQYRVEVKVVSVPKDAANEIPSDVYNAYYSNAVVGQLMSSPRARVVSCPVAMASTTKPVTIDGTKKVTYAGKRREVGLYFSATPIAKAEPSSNYQLTFSNVSFGGYSDPKGTTPVFHIQRLNTTMMVFQPPSEGYCCFNLRAGGQAITTYDANGRRMASIADANERQLLFVKITRG